jgi:putative hydrolase of the HAD superfamily
MPMLRAVFFDVGNTLLYPYPSVSEVVRQVLADEGHVHDLSAIDAYMPLVDEYYEDRYREDDTFWTDENETSTVWVGMYSLLCRRLGIDADAERIARRVYDEFGDPGRWRPYDDVVPAFERLRSRGTCVGLISNWDRRLAGIFTGLGLGGLLDTVVSSAEVGLHKPDPRIFELALERVGVHAEDAAHVGDHHYADALGAEAVGMIPVLIDRHGGEDPGRGLFIRSLDELDQALGWS